MKAILAILTILLANFCVAQSRTITGTIVSADMEPLPRVDIYRMDTVVLGTTEMNGTFEMEVPSNATEILVGWIGMEWQIVELQPHCNTVNVLLMYAGNYCHRSDRKNERRRRKYLAQQPELLQQAYEQGIFGTEKPCR
ncbi:MAG: hypothetical protein CMB80_26530 [Flammeovirgaceae bacterium]|nr:hypothetical protein [Flammeovirgaceae bacterium]MBE61299.1 hypothetical protein [Flammeovirgaceae bacterium]HCX21919.1 hypothetical protein [Cytophagales bacterium]|tara:strand:- start:1732 stop:2148 length:417 start_codon:yes stop_codon:yes gene_type:complete